MASKSGSLPGTQEECRLGGKVATESPYDLFRVLLRPQVPDLLSPSFLAAKATREISLAAASVSSLVAESSEHS